VSDGLATKLRPGWATDTGLVRRNNQDHLLVSDTLFSVADGMGGHAAGEVASQVAIDALRKAFSESGPVPTSNDLVDAVRYANTAVFAYADTDPAFRGMGTTLTAAAVVVAEDEERIAVANVGDSRAYVFAHGDLTQLTEDHSVAEELVRTGQISPEEVDRHPQRHILTRALGIFPEIVVDLWEVLPYPGDRILLCSDGLVREITDEQIAGVLRRLADPSEAAGELVARARSAGGSDNITVIVVDVVTKSDPALAASQALAASVAAGGTSAAGATDAPAADTASPADEPDSGTTRVASAGAPGETRRGRAHARRAALPARRRRFTLRAVVFVVVLLGVVVGAGWATVAYARDSYFVTLGAPGTVAASPLAGPGSRPLIIEKGRPGGLLWFHPTLVERTAALSDEVLPSRLPDLRKGRVEPSLAAARAFVVNLVQEAAQAAPTTTLPTLPTFPSTTATTRTVGSSSTTAGP
jgi:serine/threonine protein phosphatase PrpC